MKKASANMWWIIIGAVIALVVMVVLLVMFTDKSNKVSGGLLDCESKGGRCTDAISCKNTLKGTVSKAFECDGDAVCCFAGQQT